MLTQDEIESTLRIDYEHRLEALGEDGLRALLADEAALRELAPRHLGDDEAMEIAHATLVALEAQKAAAEPAPETPAPPPWAWPQFLSWFWTPLR